jgi:hypothetical protein
MAKRLFLERRTYRRNRLQDAARLMPVLGALLIFGPVFIRGSDPAGDVGLAGWLIYFFVIWLGLIVLSAVVSRALARVGGDDPTPGGDGP